MGIYLILKGMIIGFSIAAPVGPIGVLCIRRTLALGRWFGLLSGLGAATADAIYGFIAGFGFTTISNFLIDQQFWLRMIGGLYLCYLGIQTVRSRPAENPASVRGDTLLSMYSSTFFLTITNPMTIISFIGIFAGVGLSENQGGSVSAIMFVLGVFLGSFFWWLILSSGVGLFRQRLHTAALVWINRLSGLIILSFGFLALYG